VSFYIVGVVIYSTLEIWKTFFSAI